jgi:hypothetical protein
LLPSTSYREIFSIEDYECRDIYCIVSDPDSIGLANPDSQSGSGSMLAKIGPKKENAKKFEESERPLYGFKKT